MMRNLNPAELRETRTFREGEGEARGLRSFDEVRT
jgi:hypothetical protein